MSATTNPTSVSLVSQSLIPTVNTLVKESEKALLSMDRAKFDKCIQMLTYYYPVVSYTIKFDALIRRVMPCLTPDQMMPQMHFWCQIGGEDNVILFVLTSALILGLHEWIHVLEVWQKSKYNFPATERAFDQAIRHWFVIGNDDMVVESISKWYKSFPSSLVYLWRKPIEKWWSMCDRGHELLTLIQQ